MKLKKNIATSEAGFIFHPGTGDSYAANPLANLILSKLKEGLLPSAIKSYVLEQYEVSSIQFERDWEDFMHQLQQANLLEIESNVQP